MTLHRPKRWRIALGVVAVALIAATAYLSLGGRRLKAVFTPGARAQPSGHSHGAGDAHNGHGHDHDEGDHGHAHHGEEEPTIATTIWADKSELFLERPYVVQGRPFEMLVHLSVLTTGKPVTEGTLTFTASGPRGEAIEVRVDRPSRPGIFIPEVTLPAPGMYGAQLRVETPELAGGGESIELPPVAVYTSAGAALSAAERAGEDEHEDAITFLKEQQWRVGLLSVPVTQQELVARVTVPGRVIAPPGAEAVVSPTVAGKVLFPAGGRFPRVGEKVEKGAVLALVEPAVAGADAVQLTANMAQLQSLDADLAVKQLEVESKIRTAELELTLAQKNYERLRDLSEQGITAAKQLLLARHELDQAETRLAGLRRLTRPYAEARQRLANVIGETSASEDTGAHENGLRVTLRSPLSGTIVEANATSGEHVGADRHLFRVVNLEKLWVEAQLSEYDLGRLEKGPAASVRLGAYPDRLLSVARLGGRLVDIGAVVNPESRTVPIRYEVPNPEGLLRVGMFADVLIETTRRAQVLAVPQQAIVDENGQAVVYVQLEGELFEKRPVELGIRDAELIEVRSGLAPGERVVTRGAYAIRLSTLSNTMPAHHHY